MKKAYQPYSSVTKDLKKNGLDPEYIMDSLLLKLQQQRRDKPLEFSESGSDVMSLNILITESEILDKGKGTHYFIDSIELTDFLMGCAKECTADMLNVFPQNGIIHTLKEDYPTLLFSIHPMPSGRKCIVLCSGKLKNVSAENPQFFCFIQEPSKNIKIDSDEYTKDTDGNECSKRENELRSKYMKLLAGTSLYMHCFPEAVKDGFPDFAKHPNHYRQQKCASVTTTPDIIDRDGVNPHFRVGHFRVLKSEVFTHKRWQTIFVKECFVKGEAKTVTMETV